MTERTEEFKAQFLKTLGLIEDFEKRAQILSDLAALISAWNEGQGFWESENTGEKLALIHSEVSEALEACRENAQSVKIPGFTGMEEELADAIIRILDFAGHHELNLAEAIFAKLRYNTTRPFRHGKAF